MGALGRLLATLFGSLFGFLTKFFVVEKAFKIASAVILLSLVALLFASLKSCAEGICAVAINATALEFPSFGMGLGVVFNTTTYTAAACYLTVWSACQLYVLKKKFAVMISAGL